MSDPVLVLSWLVLAHLIADFVLQNDWIALSKASHGRRGWVGLFVHGGVVAICLLPIVLAFGGPGLAALAAMAGSHILVDRWKVDATRHAEAVALADAHRRHEHDVQRRADAAIGLGSAWTPVPGVHFVVDQLLHLLILAIVWAILLSTAPLTAAWESATSVLLASWDPGVVHHVALTGTVVASLVIVNTRGAFFFVATLVHPREIVEGEPEPAEQAVASPAAPPAGYTVRVGPLVATVEPEPRPASPPPPRVPRGLPTSAPARIGATIGALERLLIVALVLTRAEAAIGFVIAAKTLARFKQLDDRGFAEYYLLGTLASVSVAIGTALLASAALSTLS